ncbi:MAG: maleylpyruvate isomerase N-terminal domain-containing protein, partial [Actinobacteria bacterium]|nr:maleylpyruvate isomerase N-terminal domain-containing protein [Actinomycetota bacterium]
MSQEVIDRVGALLGQFDQRVQAASADDWSKQSPCEEWKARDVVAHVGNNLRGLTAGLTGGQPSQIGADDDIVAAWNDSRDGFMSALT